MKPEYKAVKIAWRAKRMRLCVFLERDRVWSRRLKRFTKKMGRWYWVACDVRSYHLGCGDTAQEAVQAFIRQIQGEELMVREEQIKGVRVIRWRCLLPPNEVKEMEDKAKKTGFILDGVECPPLPKAWEAGLRRFAQRQKRKKS